MTLLFLYIQLYIHGALHMDPQKSERNLRARGFGFEFAMLVFNGLPWSDATLERTMVRSVCERLASRPAYTSPWYSLIEPMVTVSCVGLFRLDGATVVSAKNTRARSRAVRAADLKDAAARGLVDLERMRSVTDEEIERDAALDNIPDDFWEDAIVVDPRIKKTPISIRIDSDVLAWYRGTGPSYQTYMNGVLRKYMDRFTDRERRRGGGSWSGSETE